MYGFQAISAANGWMITFAGITIVFAGLAVLATLISNLERLLTLWDRRMELLKSAFTRQEEHHPIPLDCLALEPKNPAEGEEVATIHLSAELMEALNHFQCISERLGRPFALPSLLEKAEKHGLSRPYSHLGVLLKSGLLVEGDGDYRGLYSWREGVKTVAS